MKYTAAFVNDEIVITESEKGIASSKEDAILILSNSYCDRIFSIQDSIKRKQCEIDYLKKLIPELMFEQRQVENRKKYV